MIVIPIESLHATVNTQGVSVALGNFDGVHLGHQSLLEAAKSSPYPAAVFTFAEEVPHFITTSAQRQALFAQNGVEMLLVAPFSLVRDLSCRDFVRFLKEKTACRHLICGFNFRFGKGAAGDADTLCALAQEHSLACTVLPEKTINGVTVSSSNIRSFLTQGKIEEANAFLGHPFSLEGRVEKGFSVGKQMEVPTLNLPLPESAVPLKQGVYVSETLVDGKVYPSVTNIGNNPTFERQVVTCETNLLDAEGDFYEKEITVRLLSFLRPEQKFSSLEKLKEAIARDVAQTRAYHEKRS